MSKELKLCPFCGGEFEMQSWQYNRHFPGSIYDFVCRRCGCTFKAHYCETKEEAIKKCNTRAERTCRNVSEWHDVDEFVCSECGIKLTDWAEVIEDEEQNFRFEYAFKYCPNCGAKVVK